MAAFVGWALTAEMKAHAREEFKTLKNEGGVLTGTKARELFAASLPGQELAQIWYLADTDKDGNLNEREFCIIKFLIYARMRQQTLPDTLPESLLASVADVHIGSASGSAVSAAAYATPPSASAYATPPLSETSIVSTESDPWTITPVQYKTYKATFDTKAENGKLSGPAAFTLFSLTQLPKEQLATVWGLADTDKDGALTEAEFAISMHLIYAAMAKVELPKDLPASLRQSAFVASGAAPPPGPSATSNPSVSITGGIAPPMLPTPTPIVPIVLPPLPTLPPIVVADIPLPDISIGMAPPTIPQLDTSPMNPLLPADLAERYGISPAAFPAYDANTDIAKIDIEVTNSVQATQLLESVENELKQIQMQIEKQSLVYSSLMEKGKLANETFKALESQRVQLTGLMQDYQNQSTKLEVDLKQSYQELLAWRDAMQKLATQAPSDPNILRQQHQQVLNEHAQLQTQAQTLDMERARAQQEYEALRREIEAITQETQRIAEMDFGIGRAPAAAPAPMGMPGMPGIPGMPPGVVMPNFAAYANQPGFPSGAPMIPGLIPMPVPADDSDSEEDKKAGKKRKSSKSSNKSKVKSSKGSSNTVPGAGFTGSTGGTKSTSGSVVGPPPPSATTSDKGKKKDDKKKKK